MSALSSETLSLFGWLVPTSVFVAGVVGSPHCVAMCGPLAMNFGRTPHALVSYHFGRMIAYTAAGALAGSIGRAALGTIGVSTAGLLVLAILLVVLAWRAFAPATHVRLPMGLDRIHLALWAQVKKLSLPRSVMSGIAGSLTVFLPCLHLYGFLTGAAATGSTVGGAAFMFTFWLSTLPALSAAPLLLKRWLGGTSTRNGRWAAGLLLTASMVSLIQFASNLWASADSGASPTQASEATESHHCHH